MTWKQWTQLGAKALFFCVLGIRLATASEETERARRTFRVDPQQETIKPVTCSTGTATYLELGGLSRSWRLDGNEGEGHFVLRSKADGSILWKTEYSGQWQCLGFNPVTKAYLLGGIHTEGVQRVMCGLVYLSESTHKAQPAVFTKRDYRAFAIEQSPNGRYLAFIGGKDENDGLFMLDTQTDKIKRLDKAPAPPPENVEEGSEDQRTTWGWNNSEMCFLTLEPDILVFEGDQVLKGSYGNDTWRKRADKRQIKRWDLEK